MKKTLLLLLFISLVVPAYLHAAPLAERWAASYTSQSGIHPSDLQALELGAPTLGTVMDVAQLTKLGIKDTKVGDTVLLTLMDDGKLKISVIDVKQEKIVQLKNKDSKLMD